MQDDLIEHVRFENLQEDIVTDINIALNENRATKKLKVCCLIKVKNKFEILKVKTKNSGNKLFSKYF